MPYLSAESAVSVVGEAEVAQRKAAARTLSLARVLLVVTLLAAPLPFGAVNTWAWATLTLLALLSLMFWGIGCVQQSAVKIFWSPLYLPAGLFLLLGVIQLFDHHSVDPIGTREALLKLMTDLIFFFLATQLLSTASDTAKSRIGLIVTGYLFVFSIFAILQFFTGNGLIYWIVKTPGMTFGPYVNRNDYAGLMEMLIPLAGTYVLFLPKSAGLRALLGFAVLIALVSMLLSGSRGGFVAMIAEILILSIILLWRRPTREGQRLATAGTLVLLAAALFFFWIDPGQVSKRLSAVINPQADPSFVERVTAARDSLGIFRAYPWIGSGLGSFETAYPRYQSIATDLIWEHAHNDYAEVLAESGLVGGLLVLGALVLFFCVAFKNLEGRVLDHSGWMQLGATLACCGLLVHSFVDFNLHIPANAAWFSACVGMTQSNFASFRRGGPVSTRWVN